MSKKVRLFTLGGYGEIGKNMTALEYKGTIIIIDAGISFPSFLEPGIDYIIPNTEYLIENKHKVKALFITHGHEDHIGAIPFILEDLGYPEIYCKNLPKELIKAKLKDHNISFNKFNIIKDNNKEVYVDSINIEFINVNHSIMDSSALYVECGKNSIFFSGDFKLDYTPVQEEFIDLTRIAKIGEKGVDLFFVDSTNSNKSGFSYSEKEVGFEMDKIVSRIDGRVIVATFASNLSRIIQVFKVAQKNNRKVVVLGRSLENIISISSKLGYLNLKDYDILNKKQANSYPDNELLYIVTGSQGEELSVLKRASRSYHSDLDLQEDDVVLVSAKVIPGNEEEINIMVNDLHRRVKDVFYENVSEIHVSGHALQEDIKLITKLLKPRYIVPVHGEYKHMKATGKLMKFLGYEEDKIIFAENGDMLELKNRQVKHHGNQVENGPVYIENREMGYIEKYKVTERRLMGKSGLIIIIMKINKKKRKLLYGPELIFKGVQFDEKFRKRMEDKIKNVVKVLEKDEIYNNQLFKKRIRRRLKRFIRKRRYIEPFVVTKVFEE